MIVASEKKKKNQSKEKKKVITQRKSYFSLIKQCKLIKKAFHKRKHTTHFYTLIYMNQLKYIQKKKKITFCKHINKIMF